VSSLALNKIAAAAGSAAARLVQSFETSRVASCVVLHVSVDMVKRPFAMEIEPMIETTIEPASVALTLFATASEMKTMLATANQVASPFALTPLSESWTHLQPKTYIHSEAFAELIHLPFVDQLLPYID
jgi:hypothetical protein